MINSEASSPVSIPAFRSELFTEMQLWSVSQCQDAVVKGALSQRRPGDSTHLLPCNLSQRQEVQRDKQCSPAAQEARRAKPQADNECHTVVTTCTFMERGGRTSWVWTLAQYNETSSINQTIKVRPVEHLKNEPQLIYHQHQKRTVFTSWLREKWNSLSKCDRSICTQVTTLWFIQPQNETYSIFHQNNLNCGFVSMLILCVPLICNDYNQQLDIKERFCYTSWRL